MAHVVRPLEIARKLRGMGYQVFFAGDGLAMNLVRQDGFSVYPLPDLNMKWVAEHFYEGPKTLHPVERVRNWVNSELELYKEIRPDAVLDDFRLTASISASIAGLVHFGLMNAHLTPYSVSGLLDQPLNGTPSFLGPGAEISYNTVRREFQLSPVNSLIEMLPGTYNLLCDIPEYAPSKNLPGNFHYVGPITWRSNLELPSWLKELDSSRPILYFTMGSTGLEQAFKVGIEALKNSDYQVILTLGGRLTIEDFPEVTDNLYLAQYGPGDEFTRMADVVICHAGNGTIYQVLNAGKPIVAMPFTVDQQWQAKRLTELGLGVQVKDFTTTSLMDAVSEVLHNKKYRLATERFRDLVNKYNGPLRSAELIYKTLESI